MRFPTKYQSIASKNRTSFFLFLFTLFTIQHSLRAQLPNAALFNTATNASGTGTLAYLSNDLHWMAAKSSSLGPYSVCKVLGQQSSWSASPFVNASWISYNHTCTAIPGEHICDTTAIDMYYRLILNLPSQICGNAISTASAYCMDLDFLADNFVSGIFVNGIQSYSNAVASPYTYSGFEMDKKTAVSLCNNWSSGSNTIVVHIKSGATLAGDLEGFLAQANQTLNPGVGKGFVTSGISKTEPCSWSATGSATIAPPAWGSQPYSYSWSPSGGNSNVSTPLSTGKYTCTVNSPAGTCLYTLTISGPPSPTIVVKKKVFCLGEPGFLKATGANSYTWSTQQQGDSISLMNLPLGNHHFTVSSSYPSPCSGVGTSTCNIKISMCSGFEEQNEDPSFDWQVFSNPGNAKIVLTTNSLTYISIRNQSGVEIRHLAMDTDKHYEEDLSDMPEGLYVALLHNIYGTASKKIMIRK